MKTTVLAAYDTLDDIVFAQRNQAYGAYELRKSYPKVLQKALIIGVTVFLLMLLVPTIYGKLKTNELAQINMKEYTLEKVQMEKKEEKPLPELEKPKEEPKVASVRFRIPEVVDNPPIEDLPPVIEELAKVNPGQETIEGTDDEVAIVAPPEDAPAPEVTKPAEVVAKEPEVFERVEIDPEFAGGINGLRTFLMNNLRYPSQAQRSNVQGRVYLSFTVEPDGSLSNINVTRGVGFGCDEEAVRVMKLMPKWKPGKQSGRAVRVKFNMPIVFTLE
ncbi:MAG TPA: energy transducer TonB [Runella sp.]|nr:energy transducer TonB [Runella sp.]